MPSDITAVTELYSSSSLKQREEPYINERIILKWILKTGCEDVGGIHVTPNFDEGWILVNSLIKFPIPLNVGNFLKSHVTY
jgi:hypothetical protein